MSRIAIFHTAKSRQIGCDANDFNMSSYNELSPIALEDGGVRSHSSQTVIGIIVFHFPVVSGSRRM